MPNHVTHKILFDQSSSHIVFDQVCPNGKFDFSLLIAPPCGIYRGNLTMEDQKDFKLNWLNWNTENWGTKWNAYSGSVGIEDGMAFILFDTAWSIPYPVISAFCNKFKIPFEHRYFEEGHNYWGIEKWDGESRTNKQQSNQEDKKNLCIELLGYDPDAREE
jgi:hypothetical protein